MMDVLSCPTLADGTLALVDINAEALDQIRDRVNETFAAAAPYLPQFRWNDPEVALG
jgi:alpha-galactosidase/6-phospho-beta-glucosidase family protein